MEIVNNQQDREIAKSETCLPECIWSASVGGRQWTVDGGEVKIFDWAGGIPHRSQVKEFGMVKNRNENLKALTARIYYSPGQRPGYEFIPKFKALKGVLIHCGTVS